MSTKFLESLLVECRDALAELNVEVLPKDSKLHLVYKKVVGQLENKCGTCGALMDQLNCCVMDVENMKMYHPGCEPTKRVIVPDPPKKVSSDEKLDAIMSMVYALMKDKTDKE